LYNNKTDNKLGLTLGTLDSLPAMPDIAQKLLALQLDTEAGEAAMLRLIEQDPLLSAKILGLANAPIMGGRKISSISDAAMLLGMRRLKSVSIGVATLSMLTNKPATKYFDPQYLWVHSMMVAIVMNSISQAMPRLKRPDENLIFLSGFLHDIGLMALHHLDSSASDELHHQLSLQPDRPIHDVEMEVLGLTHVGLTHGQIGERLVSHWNLPLEIISVVEMHHSILENFVPFDNPLIRMVSLAEKLLPDLGIAEHTGAAIDEREWQELGIESSREDEFINLSNELAMQFVHLFDHQRAPALAEEGSAPSGPLTGNEQDKIKKQAALEGELYHSRIEIGRLLQSIANENIQLSADLGEEQIFISRILSVNPDAGHFVLAFAEYKPSNSLLYKSPTLEFTANFHGAHLTFKVLQPIDTMYEGQPALQFLYPRAVLLHHRRQHKRIGIPKDISLNLIAGWGDLSPIEIKVVDISMDGFGCILYKEGSTLQPGSVLKGCLILLPNGKDVAVDLIVRHTSPFALKDGTVAYRTGVRFIQTPKEIEPLINHFVKHLDDTEI
jgi:putative nucleotidyltransferase with HDIG domain